MAYTDTLTGSQKANMALLIAEMEKQGIINPLTKSAILSIVSKETEFNAAAKELSYKGTANDRIKKIFSSTQPLSDVQLNELKANPSAFFNFVYGPSTYSGKQLGNTQPNDGYNFRGRGFNQITGRSNYQNLSNLIGVDLISNPDKLAEPSIAAKALVAYFKQGVGILKSKNKLSAYNAIDINDFKTLPDSVGAIYHVNAGAGTSKATLDADATGGRAKAVERSSGILELVKGYATGTVDFVKKKPLITIAITALLIVSAYILYKQIKKK